MYNTIISSVFTKQLKKLSKKYLHLKDSIIHVLENFNKVNHTHLSKNIYKIRLATQDINKGKSWSFRLIIYIIESDKYIVPITIYFKGNQENISKKEINYYLELILEEIRNKK